LDLTEEFKVRLAYSRTVARPTYRELQPFPLLNVLTNEVEVGNAGNMQSGIAPNPVIPVIPDAFASYRGLTMAKVENYDLRFEWYPAEDAQVAVGFFYKKVGNPIERVQAVQQNFSPPVFTFVNNENAADLFGIEIEAQHNLGTLFKSPALDFLYMGANVTLIDATVDRTDLETQAVNLETDINLNDISRSRSLYDQPDLIANIYATATFDRIGGELTLSLNHTGERLVGALGAGGPDIFEDAVSTINLVYTQRFKRYDGLSVKFSAKNLNDPTYRRITKSGDSTVPFFDENGNAIGERALESYKEGVSYSISVGYEF
jgi:outer membrane receptor protein involved in Fe transport